MWWAGDVVRIGEGAKAAWTVGKVGRLAAGEAGDASTVVGGGGVRRTGADEHDGAGGDGCVAHAAEAAVGGGRRGDGGKGGRVAGGAADGQVRRRWQERWRVRRRRGDGYEESEEGTAGLRRRWAESGSGVVRETRRAAAVRKGDMERAARRCAQRGASEAADRRVPLTVNLSPPNSWVMLPSHREFGVAPTDWRVVAVLWYRANLFAQFGDDYRTLIGDGRD